MEFIIDNKEYNVTNEELEYRFINEGMESNVYRFRDEAFKIYKDNRCYKTKLNEKDAKYLSKIDTKRIIMPKKLIYDKNKNFIGYTLPYLTSCSKEILRRKKISNIISELKLIEKDLITLRDNNIDIEDLNIDNFIVNTGLYIIDPGSYLICKNEEKRIIEKNNKLKYIEFMINSVFPIITKLSKKQKQKLEDFISCEYISNALDYNHEENETLLKYIKRIVK